MMKNLYLNSSSLSLLLQDQSQNRQQYRGMRNQNYQNYGYQNRDQGMNQRGGWIQRGPPRPRGNRARGGQGGYRPMNQNQGGLHPNQQGGKKKNTLKFDNDYDFDKANTEFEELRSQLTKVNSFFLLLKWHQIMLANH